MNPLTRLKQEAREKLDDLLSPDLNHYDGEAQQFLDTLIERVVAEVEKSVVPEEKVWDESDSLEVTNHKAGQNFCRTAVLEAFAKFKGA